MLLDTHVLLWLLTDDGHLGSRAREQIHRAAATHVSAASLWEIAIKADGGRLTAPDDLLGIVERSGLHWLPVTPEHAWCTRQVRGLPHRDPFDRILVSQALVERLPLLTADRLLLSADVPDLHVVDARA